MDSLSKADNGSQSNYKDWGMMDPTFSRGGWTQ